MTPAQQVRTAAHALVDIASELEAEAPPERPRKHAVTVAWCEGDQPRDAIIMTSHFGRPGSPLAAEFAMHALSTIEGMPALSSSPAPLPFPTSGIVGAAEISGVMHVYTDVEEFLHLIGSRGCGIAAWVDKTVVHWKWGVAPGPSPAPDAVKARAALVRLAAAVVSKINNRWTQREIPHSYLTRIEAIVATCDHFDCPIPAAEVEAILAEQKP